MDPTTFHEEARVHDMRLPHVACQAVQRGTRFESDEILLSKREQRMETCLANRCDAFTWAATAAFQCVWTIVVVRATSNANADGT